MIPGVPGGCMSRRWLAGFLIVLVLTAAAFFIARAVRSQPVAVAFWDMKKIAINETVTGVATGYVEPAKRLSLQPEISARIREVKVKRGDRVKAGQVLVVLDDADIRDQILALDAAIPLFEARVKQAKAHAAQLKLDFARAERLHEAGSLTVQQFENAKMAIDLGSAEGDAADSALRQARVNRDIAAATLRKTRVIAPFDGLLLDSTLEAGQLWGGLAAALPAGALAAGFGRPEAVGMMPEASTLLSQAQGSGPAQGQMELADDSQMFVIVDVDENDYGKLRIGQPASLTIEALGKRKAAGSVVEIFPFISRALDQNRTSRVKIRLGSDREAGIVPGMSVNAEILISSRNDVLAAPTAAILVRPRGKVVYRVAGGKLEETVVKTGISNWEWSEITSGLAIGDRIAKPPENAALKDGLRVVEKDREL
jgi:HlyD family secretion protein